MKMETKLFWWVKILAILGLCFAIFLLWEQLFRPPFQPCNISSSINCDAVISGPVSKTLGLPTPLFGFIGYIVIFFSGWFKQRKLLLAVVTFGFLFCAWIAYQELIILKVICPVCIGCDLVISSEFILSVLIFKHRQIT